MNCYFLKLIFLDNYRSFALKRRQLLNRKNTEAQLYTNHKVRDIISTKNYLYFKQQLMLNPKNNCSH